MVKIYQKSIKSFGLKLKNMESNARAVYDNGYIKPKIRKYGDKVYINFLGLNVSEVGLY